MLEKFEAVDVIAAALKSLTKEPNDTPISLSEERPLPARGGTWWRTLSGGGGYKGNRSGGGGRSSSGGRGGSSDRGSHVQAAVHVQVQAARRSSGPRDGSTQRSTRTRSPRNEG